MKNILLCGVGGQGTVLASRILASAAMENGEFAVTAETIGMAQRGGSVVSHVRTGQENEFYSPLIPEHSADIIIGFEPGEAVRNIRYLKDGGTIVVSSMAAYAVTAPDYDGKEAVKWLKDNIKNCFIVDTEEILNKTGTLRVLNVALIGAAAKCGNLDIDLIERVLEKKLKPKFLELNKKALCLGAGMVV
ncbi:MAG: pyruvate ferredoxin oxidoreductase [Clostridiales bacterium]|nr:MAG: pyruvate ferredoxin oxidoreductase [Clostridiales bacterium]